MRFLILMQTIAQRLFYLLLLIFATAARAEFEDQNLEIKLHAPRIVDPRDDLVVLRCDYDLKGKDLYSVNWYKNDNMLYRFLPSVSKKGTSFPNESDVNVSIERSNGTHLVLRGHRDTHKNMAAYKGTYFCEVSTEIPFLTGYAMANISAAITPKKNPVLEGVLSNYQVGDELDAFCTSAPSLPASELTFYLNNKKIDRGKIRKDTLPIGDALLSTTMSLSLLLERHHFVAGSLTLTCRSTLPGIKLERDYKTEKVATLATNNQRLLAQELPFNYSSAMSLQISRIVLVLLLIVLFVSNRNRF